VVEAPAAVSFAGAICAPTLTVGGDGGGEVKWWRSGDGEDGDDFPSLAAPLSDRTREYRWGVAAEGEPYILSLPAPPIFIAQYDGAHQPCRVGRPRSGCENKA
jgi:hypothetical protein